MPVSFHCVASNQRTPAAQFVRCGRLGSTHIQNRWPLHPAGHGAPGAHSDSSGSFDLHRDGAPPCAIVKPGAGESVTTALGRGPVPLVLIAQAHAINGSCPATALSLPARIVQQLTLTIEDAQPPLMLVPAGHHLRLSSGGMVLRSQTSFVPTLPGSILRKVTWLPVSRVVV